MLYDTHLLRHLRRTVGFNIHRLRAHRKMPLGVLSAKSEIPRDKLDHYELGKGEITLDHMLKIACLLDVEVRDLLSCPSVKR
jgi:DNA-binding Xre family transcriptional regulator